VSWGVKMLRRKIFSKKQIFSIIFLLYLICPKSIGAELNDNLSKASSNKCSNLFSEVGTSSLGSELRKGAPIYTAIECGSTTVKAVVLDENKKLIWGLYKKHNAKVFETSAELLQEILDKFKDQKILNVGFSGSP
jgi:activator of 2-hydroxyglutaryl-CoA dehydratase